jgi:prevent-host-death family protein
MVMARKTAVPRVSRPRRPRRVRAGSRLAAAAFKATCLELMDRVRETGGEYIVTKHGRPVAKLVPYAEPARVSFFGSMKGSVLKYDGPFDPIDGDYDING